MSEVGGSGVETGYTLKLWFLTFSHGAGFILSWCINAVNSCVLVFWCFLISCVLAQLCQAFGWSPYCFLLILLTADFLCSQNSRFNSHRWSRWAAGFGASLSSVLGDYWSKQYKNSNESQHFTIFCFSASRQKNQEKAKLLNIVPHLPLSWKKKIPLQENRNTFEPHHCRDVCVGVCVNEPNYKLMDGWLFLSQFPGRVRFGTETK